MRIVETPVYDFTELSDAARDKARAWFRETIDTMTMTGGTASTTTSSGSARSLASRSPPEPSA